jgi:hypothetical protein
MMFNMYFNSFKTDSLGWQNVVPAHNSATKLHQKVVIRAIFIHFFFIIYLFFSNFALIQAKLFKFIINNGECNQVTQRLGH